MRKQKPKNERQFDLPLDGNLALKPDISRSEIKPPTTPHKEVKMPKVSEVMARYNAPAPEPDDDKDEDPEAQKRREWGNYFRGRRA